MNFGNITADIQRSQNRSIVEVFKLIDQEYLVDTITNVINK